MKRIMGIFLASLLAALVSPSRPAAALSCALPHESETLTLELEDVTIDGEPVSLSAWNDTDLQLTAFGSGLQLVVLEGGLNAVKEDFDAAP